TLCLGSDAAPLWRAATVVRDGRDVLDRLDVEARRGEGADGRLASGAGTLHLHVHRADAVLLRQLRRVLRRHLRGERSPLAGALPGAGVGVGALAARRQAAAVAHAAVAVDFHQPLDVEADVLAEVALHLPLVGDDLADLPHVILGEVLDARVATDPRRREDV